MEHFEKTVQFSSSQQTWISASTLNDLLQLKAKYPNAHIIAGNTYLGKDAEEHHVRLLSH